MVELTEKKRAARREFEQVARDLHDGRICDNEFLRRTDARWRAMGRLLFRRWRRKLPTWVEPEDLVHEVQMLAVKHARECDLRRGNVGPYTVWMTYRRAQRELHRMRGAKLSGNESKNPSRFEIPFCKMRQGADGEPWDAARLRDEFGASPIDRIESFERYQIALSRCSTMREVIFLRALEHTGGSIAGAADLILGDWDARVTCRLSSRTRLVKAIQSFLGRMAENMGIDQFMVVQAIDSGERLDEQGRSTAEAAA